MNALPINKIFLAGFAFALTHWKKIIEISIFPLMISLPFLMIVPELLGLMEQMFSGGELLNVQLPDNMMIYLILFFYGYITLSINMYRLVMLGEQSTGGFMPVLDVNKIIRFIGLTLFVGLVTVIPVMITGMPLLQLIVYFLIIPITLNFVGIAIDQPSKYKWNLSFTTHMNLFFLQAILPALVGMLFAALSNIVGLGSILEWVAKVVVFYWTLVTLALCYQLIQTNSSA
ncbi:MAG TPA: hypothetical protein DCG46_03295 [Gammaproteobacteria bacterium]|jgi:hypothetical protein|nr:hypothetical protein [Gammaproteobacteria bacterium]HAE70605.1 hypothetical protein [Gammaproteobacteria bacterium]HAE72870.1 hypothetical protein [Gammaproteobacteria bacterium]HAG47770.1 hypothetical protein [Gammaproteobacteria bacterium]HAO38598.1 hypothetical protein [Gammaproteobacteria bacterium]